jgi:hypothetical protein
VFVAVDRAAGQATDIVHAALVVVGRHSRTVARRALVGKPDAV